MADAGAVVAAVDIDEAGLSATAHGREGTHTGFTSFPARLIPGIGTHVVPRAFDSGYRDSRRSPRV
ncbi:MAG: hypothetical protein QF910_00650 [Myxococcota bacterium]|jgi:hypothetical protein|nr:hypothetical protein [Myxococcota bacterium]